MGLFDQEKPEGWFEGLYRDLLSAYPNNRMEAQIKKFWYGLKWYQARTVERAMKQAVLKYATFPTVANIIDFIPEEERRQRKIKNKPRDSIHDPRTQRQWELSREMWAREKDLIGKSVELTWEYYEEECRRYGQWYNTVFWPAYVKAGEVPDPPIIQEERERGRAILREWIAKAGKKMDISPPVRQSERQTEPEFAPPRQERPSYDQYRSDRSDDEVPF